MGVVPERNWRLSHHPHGILRLLAVRSLPITYKTSSLGVKDKDIQTDYISIEPIFGRTIDPNTGLPLPVPIPGYDWDDLTKPAYYLVRKGIGIKLTDVSGFDRVLTGLITNGVNHVQGIDFRTSELRKHKDKARAMAIRAAKEKAEAMAEELGVKVGKPYNITVNEWGDSISWSRVNKGFGGGGAGGGGTSQNPGGGSGETGPTFSAGQISVSASVNVSFLIQ
jgi:uncharacterized protein YggE